MNVLVSNDSGRVYVAYFDGSYKKGIGMGCGMVVYKENEYKQNIKVWERSIKHPAPQRNNGASNNVAEYLAFISLLDYFIENKLTGADILVRGDSMMVVKQMSGDFRIKSGRYVKHALRAKDKVALFSNLRIYWCPRLGNKKADLLSKI